jgi:hypothetical protein
MAKVTTFTCDICGTETNLRTFLVGKDYLFDLCWGCQGDVLRMFIERTPFEELKKELGIKQLRMVEAAY